MAARLPEIKRCPRCSEGLWFYYGPDPTWIRWTFWTDGKDTRELGYFAVGDLRRCNICKEFFLEGGFVTDERAAAETFLKELVRGVEMPTSPEAEQARGEAVRSDLEALYDGLSVLVSDLTPEQERVLRIQAWRLENDRVRALRFRVGHPLAQAEIYFSTRAVDSMRRLFDLLGEAEEVDRFYRAELARELGAFDAAVEMFDRRSFSRLARYAQCAQELARKRDRYVANLSGDAGYSAELLAMR